VAAVRLAATTAGDLLGVWAAPAPASVPAGQGLLPGAPAESAGGLPGLVWQAQLPADPGAAAAVLRGAEDRLAAVEPALAVAAQRLAEYPQTATQPALLGLPPAETKLTEYLHSETAQAALADIQQFVQQLRDVLAPQASIETTLGGAVVARSVLTINSDLRTAWLVSLDAERASLHQRTVDLALKTRAALLRTVAFTIRGAAVLAVGAAAGPLALPAAWHFIEDVRSELTHP
jgi:hypothetical protein